MHVSYRATLVRNFAVSIVNGTITLVILLIAPLGLASVIANTFLVAAATYLTATLADQVVRFLTLSKQQAELLSRQNDEIRIRNADSLQRRSRDRSIG